MNQVPYNVSELMYLIEQATNLFALYVFEAPKQGKSIDQAWHDWYEKCPHEVSPEAMMIYHDWKERVLKLEEALSK